MSPRKAPKPPAGRLEVLRDAKQLLEDALLASADFNTHTHTKRVWARDARSRPLARGWKEKNAVRYCAGSRLAMSEGRRLGFEVDDAWTAFRTLVVSDVARVACLVVATMMILESDPESPVRARACASLFGDRDPLSELSRVVGPPNYRQAAAPGALVALQDSLKRDQTVRSFRKAIAWLEVTCAELEAEEGRNV